jgi:hypothetical protein
MPVVDGFGFHAARVEPDGLTSAHDHSRLTRRGWLSDWNSGIDARRIRADDARFLVAGSTEAQRADGVALRVGCADPDGSCHVLTQVPSALRMAGMERG